MSSVVRHVGFVSPMYCAAIWSQCTGVFSAKLSQNGWSMCTVTCAIWRARRDLDAAEVLAPCPLAHRVSSGS